MGSSFTPHSGSCYQIKTIGFENELKHVLKILNFTWWICRHIHVFKSLPHNPNLTTLEKKPFENVEK